MLIQPILSLESRDSGSKNSEGHGVLISGTLARSQTLHPWSKGSFLAAERRGSEDLQRIC